MLTENIPQAYCFVVKALILLRRVFLRTYIHKLDCPKALIPLSEHIHLITYSPQLNKIKPNMYSNTNSIISTKHGTQKNPFL